MRRNISILILGFILLGVQYLHAQFAYDKIEDETEFELDKPISYYTNSRYNRIEGLFLNGGVKYRPQNTFGLQFYSDVGVGFWNDSGKRFRYTVGARKDFFDFKRLSFGAEYFRKLASNDDWRIGDVENSLASFFLRNDHRDYFGKQGIKFYIDHKFLETHTLRLEVSRHTYDAVEKNIDWSVFKGKFPENPRRIEFDIPEGDETSVRLIAAFDWRDNPIFPISGWYIEGIYEKTFDDFETDGLFLTIKRFQEAFGIHRLFIRGMVGTRSGDIGRLGRTALAVQDTLFQQYSLDLGGIGSLRGFEDKEFSGNRMLMLNFNYLFGGDILQRVPLQDVPFFGALWSTLSLGLFVDTGWAWLTDFDSNLFNGFDDWRIDDLKTNVGVSVLALEGVLRLDIAKRTDRSNDDFRVTLRLLESF